MIKGRVTLGVIPSLLSDDTFVPGEDMARTEVRLALELRDFENRATPNDGRHSYTGFAFPSQFLQNLGDNPEWFLRLEIFPLKVK